MPQLVLLRHGESVWNRMNVFTGWVDVPLSPKGIEEALSAGDMIAPIEFDRVYVSTLVRAMQTALLALSRSKNTRYPYVFHPETGKTGEWSEIYREETMRLGLPVVTDWRLNERYYGKLQGKNKQETAREYGDEQVKLWRRSYSVRPPEGESLSDTAERTWPFFEEKIWPDLRAGRNVLVSAHGNSLRSIVMHLDHLTQEEVLELEIPTGVPMVYFLEAGELVRQKTV